MDLSFLSQFIDANKIGGWVRAGVASLLAVAIGKFPGLSTYLDPGTQQALGVAVAGVAVGIWSQLTKTDKAKIEMVRDLANDPTSPVKGVVITNTAEGQALAASIPGPVEVAGGVAATSMAKA